MQRGRNGNRSRNKCMGRYRPALRVLTQFCAKMAALILRIGKTSLFLQTPSQIGKRFTTSPLLLWKRSIRCQSRAFRAIQIWHPLRLNQRRFSGTENRYRACSPLNLSQLRHEYRSGIWFSGIIPNCDYKKVADTDPARGDSIAQCLYLPSADLARDAHRCRELLISITVSNHGSLGDRIPSTPESARTEAIERKHESKGRIPHHQGIGFLTKERVASLSQKRIDVIKMLRKELDLAKASDPNGRYSGFDHKP